MVPLASAEKVGVSEGQKRVRVHMLTHLPNPGGYREPRNITHCQQVSRQKQSIQRHRTTPHFSQARVSHRDLLVSAL